MTPTPTAAPVIPLKRLHPLSPVLKGLRLLAIGVAAISLRGLQELGFWNWLLAVGLLLVVTLIYSVLLWRSTGYEVIGRELRIHEGLLSRRVRAVPLERVQAIEVVQPMLARPAGLAELKLDVAGAQRAEAPLAYLPLADAVALRTRLLTLSAGPERADELTARQPAEQVVEQEEPHLVRVNNREVAVSQFLTPPVMFAPLAVLYIIGQLVYNQNFGFFSVASMLTALFGTIGAPTMRMLNFWNFRLTLARDPKHGPQLRIRHGLLETRSQTVAVRRVQSLTITWPLLWRRKRWQRITLAVAGQTSGGQDGRTETDRLLPVAGNEQARTIVPLVLPGVDLAALPMTLVPPQARWLAPLRRNVLAAGLTEQVFGTVDGVLTRQLTLVPYQRIQSVRVTQGPLQRRLRLATVHVDIAGGVPASAQHRALTQAYEWADELTARARAARAADAGSGPDVDAGVDPDADAVANAEPAPRLSAGQPAAGEPVAGEPAAGERATGTGDSAGDHERANDAG